MYDGLPGYISCDIFYYLLFIIFTIYIDSISLIQDKDNLPIIYHVFRKSYGKEITYSKNNYWPNLRSAQILVAG